MKEQWRGAPIRGPRRGLTSKCRKREVVETITEFAPVWDELFPAEQARIVRLLAERVDLSPDGMHVRMRAEGLQTLVAELRMRAAA